jgi:hypothetical protein
MTLTIKILAVFVVIWVIAISGYVIISLKEFKFIPVLAVFAMSSGVIYSLFIYFYGSEKGKYINMDFKDFEFKNKIAKPLRLFGMVLLFIQLLVWLDVFQIPYESYISVIGIIVFSSYILLLYLYYKNISK